MEQAPEKKERYQEINADLEFMTEMVEQRIKKLLENLQQRKKVTHPTDEEKLLLYAADEATNIVKLVERMVILVKKKPLS